MINFCTYQHHLFFKQIITHVIRHVIVHMIFIKMKMLLDAMLQRSSFTVANVSYFGSLTPDFAVNNNWLH